MLHGKNTYRLVLDADQLPPNSGFWSLTLYDEEHGLYDNPWKVYSVGGNEASWSRREDGSVEIVIQPEPPLENEPAHWLPSPKTHFSLYLRVYGPAAEVIDGEWTPPLVARVGSDPKDLATAKISTKAGVFK